MSIIDLELPERLSAPLSLESFRDLCEWWCCGPEPQMSPPLCLGWDIHRQWPNADGFALWRDLMHGYEPPCYIPGIHEPVTMERYEAALAEQWARYDRPKHWTDDLIVDVLHDERARGYEPGGAGWERTETILNDLAAKCGAKRAAVKAEEDAREARRLQRLDRFFDLDDVAYAKWVAAGMPFIDALKWERWTDRRRRENAKVMPVVPLPPVPIPSEILERHKREREQYEAAILGPMPEHGELPIEQAEALSDFWAHIPSGKIIHGPSRGLWNAGSVDKHLGRIKDAMRANGPGMQASTWLSQFRPVQGMGWDPSQPMIIEGRMLTENGWIRSPKCRTFNIYLPADIEHIEGDVSPFLDHVKFVYPDEWQHIIHYLAFKVQNPGDKINHGLVFIGAPGIGKDTILEPAIAAMGAHNFKSISAARFFKSEFNGYLKSVMCRIDEVHDLGGESKFAFHDRTKTMLAAPPTANEVNEKNVPHYTAVNVCGVVMTSNHDDALYLPRDDRRHFVCVSQRSQADFPEGYFDRIYGWFAKGGNEAVAHFLSHLDLSEFNAKAPPRKTAGWKMIVAAGMAPEAGDMTDVIETLGHPVALTLSDIRRAAMVDSPLRAMLDDPKARRLLPKRLAECGYVAVANPDATSGRWRMPGGRVTIYGRKDAPEGQRLDAARSLTAGISNPPPPPQR
jgi:hypothetical protein